MTTVGVRELKDRLSHYLRRAEAGERVVVTDRGRAIAELRPAAGKPGATDSPYERLLAAGLIRPALERGDPLEGLPGLRLPRGTARALIDADRGE